MDATLGAVPERRPAEVRVSQDAFPDPEASKVEPVILTVAWYLMDDPETESTAEGEVKSMGSSLDVSSTVTVMVHESSVVTVYVPAAVNVPEATTKLVPASTLLEKEIPGMDPEVTLVPGANCLEDHVSPTATENESVLGVEDPPEDPDPPDEPPEEETMTWTDWP